MELVPFNTGQQLIPPLGTGQLDVALGGPSAGLFNAIGRDIELRIVADKGSQQAPDFVYAYVVVRKDLSDSGQVKRPGDLKGRSVAVSALGSLGHLTVDSLLRKDGLTVQDVNLVTMPYPDMAGAFANKIIDASFTIEPLGVDWVEKDLVVRLPPTLREIYQMYGRQQGGVAMYGEQFVRERPEVARRWLVAYLRGVRDYNDAFRKGRDREAIVGILSKNLPIKDPALYDKMGLPGFDPDGYVDGKNLDEQQDWYIANGFQQEKVDLRPALDSQFVDYALGRLGKYQP